MYTEIVSHPKSPFSNSEPKKLPDSAAVELLCKCGVPKHSARHVGSERGEGEHGGDDGGDVALDEGVPS